MVLSNNRPYLENGGNGVVGASWIETVMGNQIDSGTNVGLWGPVYPKAEGQETTHSDFATA